MIVPHLSVDVDVIAMRGAFERTVALYQGAWAGIKGCNTDYHDLKHVTDCYLALVRLLHGACETGVTVTARQVHQVLVAALLHDSGYLQYGEDSVGTGAKFTLSHVRRSMDFLERYHDRFDLRPSEVHACMTMIHSTDLNGALAGIPFPDSATKWLGKMLAGADVLAQLADRTYLEKLLFLYFELEEARLPEYRDELDLLQQSIHFYQRINARLKNQLGAPDRFMRHHFKARWDIDEDLYRRAIDNQRRYLRQVLKTGGGDPRDYLRRANIVQKIRSRYN
ncbi:conserved hypothetical protein [Desulfosarcina cetonica]|nr:conserved hypothetical protein [Desulfosarcina cetonica]